MNENILGLELNENEALIVGINTNVNADKGTVSTLLSCIVPYEAWREERASRCEGFRAETEFTHVDCSELEVGNIVKLVYSKGYKGEAKLAGVVVVR